MSASLKLYEATAQMDTVREWLIEQGGELTPEIEELLEAATGTFNQKAECVALFVREMEATAAAVQIEADRLAKLAASYTNAAKQMKNYLQREMEHAEIERVEGALCKVRLQLNPPSVQVAGMGTLTQEELDAIAEETFTTFVRLVPQRLELDKKAVIEAWKHGVALPSRVSVVQTRSVRIS